MPEALKYEGGAYRTAPGATWALMRALPSFFFYCQDAYIVLKAGWQAKRGRYDTPTWVSSSHSVLRALERVGVTFEITGVDYVQALDRPAVFIGNHMSTLETFVLPGIIAAFRETTFIVKQRLVEMPVFKHVMRSRDPITVGRTNPREDLQAVLEGGEQRLKNGVSIVVFPQTTRTPAFDPKEFNSIGVKLAKKAGAPIVPIALKTDAWANGKLVKDVGKIRPSRPVHIAFGKPLMVADRGREEQEHIVHFIAEKLAEWNK